MLHRLTSASAAPLFLRRPAALAAWLLAVAGAAQAAPALAAAAAQAPATVQAAPNPAPNAAPDASADFPVPSSPEALKVACDQGLADSARELKVLERRPADAGWLAAFDRFSARVEDRSSPLTFLSAVHPDKAMRDAAEACELRWTDFSSTLGQNPRLYQAVRRLNGMKGADAIDRELLSRLRGEFEDAGVALPPARRAEAKRLNDRIVELGQAFERNIRDAGIRVRFTEAELQGVPRGVWEKAPREADGRIVLDVSYPVSGPVMQLADREAARERMWKAKVNEGGEANLKLLAEIVALRQQYATLLGARTWAEFQTRRRMAATPQRVQRFLDEVGAAVEPRERAEIEELRRAKAEQLGQPLSAVRLERWDVGYYLEKLKQSRYKVDQEAFRRHFPPQASLDFSLRLVERLMGVRYTRLPEAKAWHPEVQTYAVSDARSGQVLSLLRVDLFPRDGKYNHAAVWGLRGSSTLQGRRSEAALVVNFDRQGLTLGELETLLHELGHAVHHNVSATRYQQHAGTSVLRDFVEAPSQMLEDWVYDAASLALFREVCPGCEPVPPALLAQAKVAKDFGKGIGDARQRLFAAYDMALYSGGDAAPLPLWAQMEGRTPLGHVPGTMFPAGFAHIAANYSAGYYGYLWSLVVATDLRTAFAADKLDPAVGRRYRDRVLAQGSQRPPEALVRDFLGRDFSSRAFFEELKR